MAPPKRPWFRVYVEMIWDRKIRRLSVTARWTWIAMLALARQSPIPGILLLEERCAVGWEDLADAASLQVREVKTAVEELLAIGLVEFDDEVNTWSIPKWNERQFESDETTKRTTKHRQRNVPSPHDETPQKTESDTETDKPKERAQRGSRIPPDWTPDDHQREWVKAKAPLINLEREVGKFVAYYSGNGKTQKDWWATFRNWCLKAQEWAEEKQPAGANSDWTLEERGLA